MWVKSMYKIKVNKKETICGVSNVDFGRKHQEQMHVVQRYFVFEYTLIYFNINTLVQIAISVSKISKKCTRIMPKLPELFPFAHDPRQQDTTISLLNKYLIFELSEDF